MTGRPGFILLYTLLVVLALSMMAAGTLAVATREGRIAIAHARIVQARATAESAARMAAAAWRDELDGLPDGGTVVLDPPGTTGWPGGSDTEVTVTLLGASTYAVRAEHAPSGRPTGAAGAGPATASARAALLIRTADRALALASIPAAVTADSLAEIANGTVSGLDVCASAMGSAPGVIAPGIELDGAAVEGSPPLTDAAPPARPLGDPLAPGFVTVIRDGAPAGAGRPSPGTVNGACAPGPWNWGSVDPGHPCHSLLPVIGADGDLVVEGGEGRAVLVALGDARIEGPATFEGLILATGLLHIGPGVTVRGAVRARHVVVDGGEVLLDRCAIDAVLDAAAFRIPLRSAERWWIPAF